MHRETIVDHRTALEPSFEWLEVIVRRHVPSYWRSRPMSSELRLDESGIGFDSIGLLELLLDLERELGARLPTDLLLDEALTLGALHEQLVAQARVPRG